MLIGEAKAQAELNNKLEGFKQNHDAVIEGYQKELTLAEKIGNESTRAGVIAEIKAQIDAQDKLYAAQVEAANFSKNYNELQKQSKDLVTAAFGDPSRVDQKLKDYKEKLENFMQEVDAIEANQKDSLTSGNIGQSLSDESMSFLGKMLKMTPEELAADFEAKKSSSPTLQPIFRTLWRKPRLLNRKICLLANNGPISRRNGRQSLATLWAMRSVNGLWAAKR